MPVHQSGESPAIGHESSVLGRRHLRREVRVQRTHLFIREMHEPGARHTTHHLQSPSIPRHSLPHEPRELGRRVAGDDRQRRRLLAALESLSVALRSRRLGEVLPARGSVRAVRGPRCVVDNFDRFKVVLARDDADAREQAQ